MIIRESALGISVRGASHVRKDSECQDRNSYKVLEEEGIIIAAVADGHGSSRSPYSAEGAQAAVDIFCGQMMELCRTYKEDKEWLMNYLDSMADTEVAARIDMLWKREITELHEKRHRARPECAATRRRGVVRGAIRPVLSTDEEEEQALAVQLEICRMYGTTLLGLMLTPDFCFALQLGDGDIGYLDERGFCPLIEGVHILGTETHSLCMQCAWEKAITTMQYFGAGRFVPSLYILTTDGFSNSFVDDTEYEKACKEYFERLRDYGPQKIASVLPGWLEETSEEGCGDDITMVLVYCDEAEKGEKLSGEDRPEAEAAADAGAQEEDRLQGEAVDEAVVAVETEAVVDAETEGRSSDEAVYQAETGLETRAAEQSETEDEVSDESAEEPESADNTGAAEQAEKDDSTSDKVADEADVVTEPENGLAQSEEPIPEQACEEPCNESVPERASVRQKEPGEAVPDGSAERKTEPDEPAEDTTELGADSEVIVRTIYLHN